jgi:hypothetical protein
MEPGSRWQVQLEDVQQKLMALQDKIMSADPSEREQVEWSFQLLRARERDLNEAINAEALRAEQTKSTGVLLLLSLPPTLDSTEGADAMAYCHHALHVKVAVFFCLQTLQQ